MNNQDNIEFEIKQKILGKNIKLTGIYQDMFNFSDSVIFFTDLKTGASSNVKINLENIRDLVKELLIIRTKEK